MWHVNAFIVAVANTFVFHKHCAGRKKCFGTAYKYLQVKSGWAMWLIAKLLTRLLILSAQAFCAITVIG